MLRPAGWHASFKIEGSGPNEVIEVSFLPNLPNPSSHTRPWGLLSL
jgi:hypothetical protein